MSNETAGPSGAEFDDVTGFINESGDATEPEEGEATFARVEGDTGGVCLAQRRALVMLLRPDAFRPRSTPRNGGSSARIPRRSKPA